MVVKIINETSSLRKTLADNGSNLVVIHFAAEWAPQCAQMNNVLQELSNDIQLSSTVFIQTDAESVPEISQQYDVSSVPTFVLLKNQVLLEKINGANAPKLTSEVMKHSTDSFASMTIKPQSTPKPEVEAEKLDQFGEMHDLHKGIPARTKMRRQLVAILDGLNAEYKSFDILTDEAVRQGLKEYSKWPTYPQVYVNGELVGGLDIIKELQEQGTLEETIPRKVKLDEKLKSLTNEAEVMVFMKGNREQPRCGFSKQLIAILDNTGISYKTFDILEDEEVRQGLKTFSNWPTYPQVYCKGSLVGGLDIIKELQETDELLATLKP